jgi:hypothetical protein
MTARLISILGFWWSVLVLIYSTRTVQDIAAPLWAQVGVDLVGQAIIPVAFFFGMHFVSLLAHAEASRVTSFGIGAAYVAASILIIVAFASDQYQTPFLDYLTNQGSYRSLIAGGAIGILAGGIVGIFLEAAGHWGKPA